MGNLNATPDDDAAIAGMGATGIGPNEAAPPSMWDNFGSTALEGFPAAAGHLVGAAEDLGKDMYDNARGVLSDITGTPDALRFLGQAAQGGPGAAQVAQATLQSGPLNAPPPAPTGATHGQFDDIREAIEAAGQSDYPEEEGSAGRLAKSVVTGATEMGTGALVAGPIGAAAFIGGGEADSTYHELRAHGVDDDTAKEEAVASGVTNAAFALMPVSMGKTIVQSVLAGGVANLGLGVASRYAQGKVLDANGYHEMAEQYRAFDTTDMLADTIMGWFAGGLGHLGEHGETIPPPKPSAVDAAAATGEEAHFNDSGIGIPTTPEAANLHAQTMAEHMDAMANGREPPVITPETARTLTENAIPDPARAAGLREQVHATAQEPAVENANAPPLPKAPVPEIGTTVPENETATDGAKPATSDLAQTATGDAMHDEMLANLERTHGDMELKMEDGSTKTVSQIADEMRQTMGEQETKARLHDVAVACFLSTGGAA